MHSMPAKRLNILVLKADEQWDSAREFQDAMALFLERLPWDHFVTLTTTAPNTPERMIRDFRDRLIRPLTRVVGGPVPYFVATERTTRGYPHLHALLSGTACLAPKWIAQTWRRFGFARATRYDARRGGARYVTKQIALMPDGWDISRRLYPLIEKTYESAR